MSEVIISYKGFNKDMTCKGKQYEEGKEYIEEYTKARHSGMHACEYPLDCLCYYGPNESVYHVVEQSGEISHCGHDSKVASTKMRIGAEIGFAELVEAAIEYTKERIQTGKNIAMNYEVSSATEDKGASSATGNYGASSATGYYGASSATGYCGGSSATGNNGASSATGYKGISSATGNRGASSATGNYGASSATGYRGASSATGNYGASSATGYQGASSATGYQGASLVAGNCGASSSTGYKGSSEAQNPESIAVAWGYHGRARGVKGAYLVLADWEGNDNNYWEQGEWKLKGAKMVRVDGNKIKENTWYTMVCGEVVEVEEE